jgi:hypothetical protein
MPYASKQVLRRVVFQRQLRVLSAIVAQKYTVVAKSRDVVVVHYF